MKQNGNENYFIDNEHSHPNGKELMIGKLRVTTLITNVSLFC
jgi:hypothetical protein